MKDLLTIVGTLALLAIVGVGAYLVGVTVGWEAHKRDSRCNTSQENTHE